MPSPSVNPNNTLIGSGVTNTTPNSLQTLVINDLITPEMVRIATNHLIREQYLHQILPALNHYAHAYHVNTHPRIAHFLSQVGTESKFLATEENLGGYSATRMRQVFGCNGGAVGYDHNTDDCRVGHHRIRQPLWTNENFYAHQAENLGNYVYSNRIGNSSVASGDGYKYRGRGLIQLTGKTNYTQFNQIHNQLNSEDHQDFIANPDLIITNVDYAIESAFVFWHTNSLNNAANSTTDNAVHQITYLVNGGYNGYTDRLHKFHQLIQYMNGPQS
jgi:predicted chitinase